MSRYDDLIRFRAVAPTAVRYVLEGRASNPAEAIEQLDLDLCRSVRADAELIVERAVERAENTEDSAK